jgi:hypothetical protein
VSSIYKPNGAQLNQTKFFQSARSLPWRTFPQINNLKVSLAAIVAAKSERDRVAYSHLRQPIAWNLTKARETNFMKNTSFTNHMRAVRPSLRAPVCSERMDIILVKILRLRWH